MIKYILFGSAPCKEYRDGNMSRVKMFLNGSDGMVYVHDTEPESATSDLLMAHDGYFDSEIISKEEYDLLTAPDPERMFNNAMVDSVIDLLERYEGEGIVTDDLLDYVRENLNKI